MTATAALNEMASCPPPCTRNATQTTTTTVLYDSGGSGSGGVGERTAGRVLTWAAAHERGGAAGGGHGRPTPRCHTSSLAMGTLVPRDAVTVTALAADRATCSVGCGDGGAATGTLVLDAAAAAPTYATEYTTLTAGAPPPT